MGEHVRVLVAGLKPADTRPIRLGIIMMILFIAPTFSPLASAGSLQVASDDFGVLSALDKVLNERAGAADDSDVGLMATGSLSGVEASLRDSGPSDPLEEVNTQMAKIALRDTSPPSPDHPRPYELLLNEDTQPPNFPSNLLDTLFGLPPDLSDPLAIGINSYVLYVNYSARGNGPQYEAWDSGTFTGDLITLSGSTPFENSIDLDGDGNDDLLVGLTIMGLGQQGVGWDIEMSDGLVPTPESLWIRPTFQWRVHMLNNTANSAAIWESMESMEVTLIKGFAYELSVGADGEGYAFVIDSSFTQPPYDFQLRVGLERMEFDITALGTNIITLIAQLFSPSFNESTLLLTEVSAPYSITMHNPNEPGTNRQQDCWDELANGELWYDPSRDHLAKSRQHKCKIGIGIGYIHYGLPDSSGARNPLEVAYIDAAFHPTEDSQMLLSEADLVFRNDNLGKDSLDTIEYYGDINADLTIHYFEDRSNYSEPDSPYGNITDASVIFRGLPGNSMPQDEINAIFTMLGAAPDSLDLPGQVPDERLSMIIAIKNFTRDKDDNVDDDTLPINPAGPPDSLILIALNERATSIEFTAHVMRYGSSFDYSRTHIFIEDIPEVLLIYGSFEMPAGGGIRVMYDDINLDIFSQFFDNILLGLVEIILDVGSIIQGLPMAIVSTASEGGGVVRIESYNQVLFTSLTHGQRTSEILGTLSLELGSSDHPVFLGEDHIVLGHDRGLDPVPGRLQLETPLVSVSLSANISQVSSIYHSFDPDNEIRDIELIGASTAPIDIVFISHDSGTLNASQHQFAHISNRPLSLMISQSPESITYHADGPIGSITYAAFESPQANAIRMEGLPSHFEVLLGDTLGYIADEPIASINIQISNSSNPKTMDGDHFYFWQDTITGEADLSARLSNLTNIRRTSPEVPGAVGELGNGNIAINRSSSAPFNVLIRDDTAYADPHLGLNATMLIDPLPSALAFDYPSEVDSGGFATPGFGDEEGVSALAFFLGDMVGFGQSVSDLVSELTRDLGGGSDNDDLALGLDLHADAPFTIIADIEKGDVVPEDPNWMHGVALSIEDRTLLDFNLSAMVWLTSTPRGQLEGILQDGLVSTDERDLFLAILGDNILQASELALALNDGLIEPDEWELLDRTQLLTEGIDAEERRSWHIRTWLPNLPPTIENLGYRYSEPDGVPTYDFRIDLEGWTPAREMLRFEMNGVSNRDVAIEISGLDTTLQRDASVRMQISTDDSFTVPRVNVDLHYEFGEPLEYAHAILIDRNVDSRYETLINDLPATGDMSTIIGDLLQIDFAVPESAQNNGLSAGSAMIQTMRYRDGIWYPATVFMHQLPGELHLSMQPSYEYDINEQAMFQGMYTLEYTSNADTLDLYVDANGKALESRSNMVMIAEDLPSRTSISHTDDWGLQISTSGDGIGRLYYRQTDSPIYPGMYLHSMEATGENLKSMTVHVYGSWLFPVVVLDDVAGGRIVATANADVEVGGITWDARGVLIDAQATGPVPSGSTFGVNGVTGDLSLLNTLTGGRADTTHMLIIEPLSSLVLTVVMTLFGGGN